MLGRLVARMPVMRRAGMTAGFDALGGDTRVLKNFLHGTWVGHPVHPILTDVAIGGFTAAVSLDLVDQVANDELGHSYLPVQI